MPWGEIVFGGAFQMSKFKQTKNCRVFWTRINTSYLTDSYLVFTLKMESVSKNTIFGLKMMVKSRLEKIFLKFLHALTMSFFITEFVLLIKIPPFYEVNSFNRK